MRASVFIYMGNVRFYLVQGNSLICVSLERKCYFWQPNLLLEILWEDFW